MNGPKLLSKNSTVETAVNKTSTTAQAATKLGKGNSIPINRYLWGDDGNASGVAKIYIDHYQERLQLHHLTGQIQIF